MSDHHPTDHDHGDTHGAHGVPIPPSDEELERLGREQRQRMNTRTLPNQGGGMTLVATDPRLSPTVPPHHFFQGPMDVLPAGLDDYLLRLRDGSKVRITHRFYWYLDRVEGTTRRKALKRLYDHLLHPQGWAQMGIHWVRTTDRELAQVWVRVLPQDTSVCGPGSAGCYSWGYDARPVAEVGVEYIDREGPWNVLVGMELCWHGTVRGDDMYLAPHQPYYGSMGTWANAAAVNYLPVPAEIQSGKEWLAGQVPADRIHWH